MRSQVLHDPHLMQHDDLWDKCESFKPDAEAPREAPGGPPSVADNCAEDCDGDQDLDVWELIAECVISRAVWQPVPHEVDACSGARNEYDLHTRVVDAHEVHEEVHIANTKDEQVNLLGLT